MHGTEEERRKPPVLLSDSMSDKFCTEYSYSLMQPTRWTSPDGDLQRRLLGMFARTGASLLGMMAGGPVVGPFQLAMTGRADL